MEQEKAGWRYFIDNEAAIVLTGSYQRDGALIARRYKSIPVEMDEYFIPLLRYIHQNSLRAGLAKLYRDSASEACLWGVNGAKFKP